MLYGIKYWSVKSQPKSKLNAAGCEYYSGWVVHKTRWEIDLQREYWNSSYYREDSRISTQVVWIHKRIPTETPWSKSNGGQLDRNIKKRTSQSFQSALEVNGIAVNLIHVRNSWHRRPPLVAKALILLLLL